MQNLRLGLLAIFFSCFAASAQKMTIENVQKFTTRSSGAIKEAADVKGYYFFYVSDKIDRKTNEYTLAIYDENFAKLKDIKFNDSKDVTVLESSFNGKDLIFLFYNRKERTFTYQVYGADGKNKYEYNHELSKRDKNYLESTYLNVNDEDQTFKGLYPIEGEGFVSNIPSREDKDYTFEISYFGSDKRKEWSYIPTEGFKKFIGDYLGTINGVVYLQVQKYKSMFDQNPDSYLVGLSLENGKQLFEKSTDLPKNKFYPASLSIANGGKVYLYGEYFNANDNVMKDKSLGFGFWEVDNTGTIKSEKYISWELGLGKYMNISDKGKIEDFGFMFIHNIVLTADGNMFAIAEGYKKVASAFGIASAVLSGGRGGGASILKLKVTDMLIINFDKDFNVKGAKIYPKNSNGIELPSGSEASSVVLIGKYVKYYFGGFDYNYTQVTKDNSSFSVCYSDYVRGKDYKGGTFNSITYNNGKFTTDKINTKSDASVSEVLPGKQGQVLVIEFFKKAKKLDMHFEKMN